MKNAKLVVTSIIVTLVLIVILQNTQTVETKLLFVSVSMPRALLLGACVLLGFVLGVFARWRHRAD